MEKQTERMRVTRETLGAERTEGFTDDNIGNQDDMIESEKYEDLLPVPLTDRERLELGENVVQTIQKIGDKKEAQKAAAEGFKAEITELEKKMHFDARILRDGKVDREVECEETRNFRNGSVMVRRLDTGEIIESRPMTSEERQQGMKF